MIIDCWLLTIVFSFLYVPDIVQIVRHARVQAHRQGDEDVPGSGVRAGCYYATLVLQCAFLDRWIQP